MGGQLDHFFVLSLTGRCRTWSADGVPPQVSLEEASPLDLDSPWAPASVLQVWELHSMQQLQICLLDWALLLSQGEWASGAGVVQSTSLLGPVGLCRPNCQPTSFRLRKGAVLVVCYK